MLSFAVISRMLMQLHQGREPSLKDAALSAGLVRMIPGIAVLTALWFGLVLVLVMVEMAR